MRALKARLRSLLSVLTLVLPGCQVKGGPPPRSNFDFAGPLTEAVLLGAVCIRNGGEKLTWDSASLKITNDPEANALLHYGYRQGWSL